MTTVSVIPAVKVSPAGFSDKLKELSIPHSILSLIRYDIAVEYSVLPFNVDEKGRVEVAMATGMDIDRLQKLQMVLGRCIKPHYLERSSVMALIDKNYGPQMQKSHGAEEHGRERRLIFNKSDSTITLVNDIIHEAIRLRASDIHCEPFEREMAVRFRVDGVFQELGSIPVARIPETVYTCSNQVPVMQLSINLMMKT